MTENVEQVSEDLIIHKETYYQVLRERQAIRVDENTPPKTKMQAIDQKLAISEKLANFINSGILKPSKLQGSAHLELFELNAPTPIFLFLSQVFSN